jgi:hypothetical protein
MIIKWIRNNFSKTINNSYYKLNHFKVENNNFLRNSNNFKNQTLFNQLIILNTKNNIINLKTNTV